MDLYISQKYAEIILLNILNNYTEISPNYVRHAFLHGVYQALEKWHIHHS